MISLGIILLIVGFIVKVNILWSIGIALVVIGLVLNLIPIGGSTRRVW